MLDQAPPEPPVAVQEVVVRGARLPPPAGAAAFSSVRLEGADLARSPRLDEVLSQAPGVSLFRRTSSLGANPTTQGLSLRSIAPSGAGRALVTLDGAPQNDPFGGWVIWSALPSETVAAVDIVRGAGAGAYGAGALTGVVSLTGLDAGDDPLRASVEAGGLDYGRAAVIAGSSDVGVLLAATAERSGGWTPVRERRGAADAPLELDALSASLKHEAARGPAAVAIRVAGYQENRQSGLYGADSRARGLQASVTAARAAEPGRYGWRLQGWALASDLANRSVAVAQGRVSTTPANDQFETPALGLGLNAAVRRNVGDLEIEAGSDLRTTSGEVRERFRYMAGDFTRVREAGGDTLIAGVYVDGSWTGGPWLLTGSARADYWTATGARRRERDAQTGAVLLDLEPEGREEIVPTARAGVRRVFGQGWHGRAAAYAGFRPPTLNELHRPFRVGNDVTEANSALKPERLYGAELGAGWSAGTSAFSATVFVNRLDDPVANVTVGIGPGTFPVSGFIPAGGVLRQRRNVGRIDAAGVEAEGQHRIGETLRLRGALAYTAAEVDGGTEAPQLTGRRPAQAPRLTATAAMDWRPLPRLGVSADLRHESGRFEDDLNTRRLEAALTVDVQASYALTPSTVLQVAVRNASNADVETGRTGDEIVSYEAPRSVRIGVAIAR